jgi:hypothetical protein
MVLDPTIPEKGLVMLYAARGTGKTHVALGTPMRSRPAAAFSSGRRRNRGGCCSSTADARVGISKSAVHRLMRRMREDPARDG